MTEKLLSAAETAEELGVSAIRVRQLANAGRIPGAQMVGGTWVFSPPIEVIPGTRGPTGVAGSHRLTDTQDLLLRALMSGPLYGYAFRKFVKDQTGGEIKLSLASIYDSLRRLLNAGLIKEAGEERVDGRARGMYKITGLGERAVKDRDRQVRTEPSRKVSTEGQNG